MTAASLASVVSQKRWLMTATGAARASVSAGAISRPSAGPTPSIEKYSPLTDDVPTRSMRSATRTTPPALALSAAMAAKAVASDLSER